MTNKTLRPIFPWTIAPLVVCLFLSHEEVPGLFIGFLWGIGNLCLLERLAAQLLLTKNPVSLSGWLILKFPLLYGIGYFIFWLEAWNPWLLAAGLALSLACQALLSCLQLRVGS